jgi:hypothetical protein
MQRAAFSLSPEAWFGGSTSAITCSTKAPPTLAITLLPPCVVSAHLTSLLPYTASLPPVFRDPHSDWLPQAYALPSSAVPSSSPSSPSSQPWRSSTSSPHACVPSRPRHPSPLEATDLLLPAQWPAQSSRSRLRRRLYSPILRRPWPRIPIA